MTYSNTYSSPSSPTNFNPFSGMGMRKGGRPSLFPGSGDGSTLNLDFTTGVLDSRLTFSRASTATFVNSSGYVEWAASNQMTYSESQDSNTFWNAFSTNVVRTAGQTDPNDGTSAVKLVYTATAGDAVISRTVAVNNGLPYTISMWMRADSGTLTNVRFGRGATAGGAFFPTLTTTWQRVSLSFTASGSADGIEIRVLNSGSPQTATFHVYGAQLESGSTVRTYQPALAATAYHAPRFDYSPTNIGEPRGLLVEGQTANLCTYSNDFNDGAWVKDGAATGAFDPTVDPTYSATGPDGASTVKRIIFNKTNGAFSRIRRQINVSNATYTMSVWMKANTANGAASTQNVGLRMGSSNGVNCVVTTTWQRFTHTFAVVDGSAEFQIMLWDNIGANGETADVLVYGAQLELGSGASSYIPTGASQVTRNADKMSMADISTMQWNQTAGTFSLHMNVSAETNTSSFPTFMGMYTATPVRVVRFLLNNSSGTTPRMGNDTWTATPSQIVSNIITRPFAPNAFKYAVSLSNTGQTLNQVVNAGTVVTTSGTGTMQTPTRLLWNQDPSSLDTEYFPIHMRSLKYWPTALPDAQLTSITS